MSPLKPAISLNVLFLLLAISSHGAPATPKVFATPGQAANALIQATRDYNVPALLDILGEDAAPLITSDDPVQDRNRAAAFASLAHDKFGVTVSPKVKNRGELIVGNDNWPFPIPLVRGSNGWYFDSKSGTKEILFRRIGENELDAIRICRGFLEAEQEYSLSRHDGRGLNEYAQKIISTPGKQDGLAWQNADGTWAGPVGENVAKALAQGYAVNAPPFHGYYFKVLKGQGPAAPNGAIDFLVRGAMIGGFALVAAPAQYRVTGVKTFLVSHNGVVYQKDLGPDSLGALKNMVVFNPDATWRRTDDEE